MTLTKRGAMLLALLVVAGSVGVSFAVSAGYWSDLDADGHELSTAAGSWSYLFDNGYGGSGTYFLPWGTPGNLWLNWANPWGEPMYDAFSGAEQASCVITPRLRWVSSGEGDPAPENVWVRLEAIEKWAAAGIGIDGNGLVTNPLGGPYITTKEWSDIDPNCASIMGNAHGIRYMKMNGTSGVLSVPLEFDCGVSGTGNPLYALSLEAYAYLHEADDPPAVNRISGVPWLPTAPYNPDVAIRFIPAIGSCQSGGDPVDLATGAHLYLPDPDIAVYDPFGPSAAYQRNFLGLRAEDGYHSTGLSTGWVDCYDVRIVSSTPEFWSYLTLVYPNGAEETLSPAVGGIGVGLMSGSTTSGIAPASIEDGPTGDFHYGPVSHPYFVTGVPTDTTGRWESITLTFADQTTWTFTPVDGITYCLSQIGNRMGRHISISRDTNSRVTSVTDDSCPANELLSFHYNGDYLSYIQDAYGRRVTYTFGPAAETTCLLSVSQVGASGSASIKVRDIYGYTPVAGQPHLTSISVPSPTGSGLSTQVFGYDSATNRIASMVDANGNQRLYIYDEHYNGTRVQIKDLMGRVVSEWIEYFDPVKGNASSGSVDALGHSTTLLYDDDANPGRPTVVADRNSATTVLTYDQFGNVLTIQRPRGTTTTYTYDYPSDEYPSEFPLGRLRSVQEGSKTPTTFEYYEPSGLVHTITSPQPGTTDGSTVTTTFTYDALGNVLTKTIPASSDTGTMTTTYNYTTDGEYTQPARLGQPLTVTDGLGHTTHYRYDDRGNVVLVKDALGNETNYTYNIADQPVSIISPAASQ